MSELEEIRCSLVRFADGEECWVPSWDYSMNPAPGSILIKDGRKIVHTVYTGKTEFVPVHQANPGYVKPYPYFTQPWRKP